MEHRGKEQTQEQLAQPRVIRTFGIHWLEPLTGNSEWYWGTDDPSGDLYEAEELFVETGELTPNRLIFLHIPSGEVLQPIATAPGQYFGRPVWDGGKLVILLADFYALQIKIIQYDLETRQKALRAILPLEQTPDCYNLLLHTCPLMLTRSSGESFQVLWPEKQSFPVGRTETFCFQDGERMYFEAWYEDPDYREEIVVRKRGTGKVVKRMPGGVLNLPDGRHWLLK